MPSKATAKNDGPPAEAQVRRSLGPAVAAGLAGPLSKKLKADLRKAPVYPEGRVVRMRTKSAARVRDVERLVDLKMGRQTF